MGRWDYTPPHVKAALAVATGFGLGLSPFASGTVGTLLGIPLAWWLTGYAWPWQVAAGLTLATLAVPFCERAEKWFGHKDDGRIVADEYLTFPLAVIGLPIHDVPLLLAVAFVTTRFCDIVKPWPARGIQALPGGYGVVLDDVIASLYALGLNWLFFLFAYPRMGPLLARIPFL